MKEKAGFCNPSGKKMDEGFMAVCHRNMPIFEIMEGVPASDTYLTLSGRGEGFYKEKGSKFIAHAYPVTTEEEIQACLDELRKQYYDARHHCYAFRLGPKAERYRANDDGEPNHSAGDPILGQIRSADLTDTLVVVIRYFGGTKLGVSGLIHAYKTAAAEALAEAPTEEKIIAEPITIQYPYDKTQEVMRLIDQFPLVIENQSFTEACEVQLAVPASIHAHVAAEAHKIPGISVSA